MMQGRHQTPAQILWSAKGEPPCGKPAVEHEGLCRWCGLPCGGRGVLAKKAEGGMFSDGYGAGAPTATHWCLPCTWLKGGRPPQTYRMWSVLWRADGESAPNHKKAHADLAAPGLHLAARNDLSAIVGALLSPPDGQWFCSLAVSGQIHTLPFARLNCGPGQWCVRLDRDDVMATPQALAQVLHHAASLYAAGFGGDEILSGEPQISRLVKYGIATWRTHAAHLHPYHTESPLLELALFLCNKDCADERATQTAGRGYCDCNRCAARPFDDELRPARDDRPEAMVAPREERADDLGREELQLAADGELDGGQPPGPGDPQPGRQMSLFDWADSE